MPGRPAGPYSVERIPLMRSAAPLVRPRPLGRANLMDRPWPLFFALLAVNAVALPYRGVIHDSQLYAVQVMNRVENGAYADDLFFRYGSQDKFSLFSVVAAPLGPPPRAAKRLLPALPRL